MKEIIPKFVPRPYQVDFFRSFFIDGKKRILRVLHRRAGKDHEAWNLCWMAAMMRPGLYLYLLPRIQQANSVIWQGRGGGGVAFLDYIPKQLIKKVNNSTMKVHLINGSIIRVSGSDNYEALIGNNAIGIVFSEYQSSNPMAWSLLRPILSENGGWAIFNGTSRGHNHLYDLYEQNKDNPDWAVSLLTVDDTRLEDGTPVINDEAIAAERRAGMPEDIIKQEYYLSWEAALAGAYYSEEMAKAKDEGRICDFAVDKDLQVHTSWDIGVRDQTSIILWQVHRDGSKRAFHMIEKSGKDASWFAFELHKLKAELGFKRWGNHFLPHDIRVREWGGGMTRIEQLQKAGIHPRIVTRVSVAERIQCTRASLGKIWFHKTNCKQLIRAMLEYHSTFDEALGVKGAQPVHNWASHACDSLSYFTVGYLETYDRPGFEAQKKYASFMP